MSITLHARHALTPTGWQSNVTLEIMPNGTIGRVATAQDISHFDVDLLLPAPANIHSHAFQRAMAGMTESRSHPRDSFWTWRKLMYRFLDNLNPEQVEAIAAMVFTEMLEAGYASVAEFHYVHNQVDGSHYPERAELSARIIKAAQDTGIGLTLLPVMYQYGGCDQRPLQGGQLRFQNTPDSFADLYGDLQALFKTAPDDFRLGIAAHSLRAVSPEGLKAVIELCPHGPIHMHLAEQIAEVEDVAAHYGARPTEWLLEHAEVDQRWCLIHCTQMTSEETLRLAATQAVAGICPLTESSLGDGIFNATEYLEAGGRIGMGSDSNIQISYFEELKTLEYSQRLRDRTRAALAAPPRSTARRLIESSTLGGAQALQRASGSLLEGQIADLMGISTDHYLLQGSVNDMLLDTLMFTGIDQHCIRDVWSAGRHVVKDGQHIHKTAIIRNYVHAVSTLRTAT